MAHTWFIHGQEVSDAAYRLFYHGQEIRRAYYRGNLIWDKTATVLYELTTTQGNPVFNSSYVVTTGGVFSLVLAYTEQGTGLAIDTGTRIVVDSSRYKTILGITDGGFDGLVNTGVFPAEGRSYPLTYYALMTPTEFMTVCGDSHGKNAGEAVLAEVGDVPCVWSYTCENQIDLYVKVYGDPSKISTTFHFITTSNSTYVYFVPSGSGRISLWYYMTGGGATYKEWGTPTDDIHITLDRYSGAVTSLTHRSPTASLLLTQFNVVQQTRKNANTSHPAWVYISTTLGTGPMGLSMEGYGSPDKIYFLYYQADNGYITIENNAWTLLGQSADGAAFKEHGMTAIQGISLFQQLPNVQLHAWIPEESLWGYLAFKAIPNANTITGEADLNGAGQITELTAEYTGTVHGSISLDGTAYSPPLLLENFLSDEVREQLNAMLDGLEDKRMWFRFSLESEDAALTYFRIYGRRIGGE